MNEDQITELMLAHANGRPLRDVLAEVYEMGHEDGYDQALFDEQ